MATRLVKRKAEDLPPSSTAVPSTPKRVRLLPFSPPRTPSTPSATATRTVYSDARKIFTRGAEGVLVGREKERSELQNFISQRASSSKGGALYVSGPPGTGKSAMVTEVCRGMGPNETLRYAYINCMSIKSASDIYAHTAGELGVSDNMLPEKARDALRKALVRKNGKLSYLVVLDEIDQLLNMDLCVLYDMFEWAFAPNSKLILIGIANALDLTDRFLPRLKTRNLKPDLLPFLPYTAPEIATVLTARCRSLLSLDSTQTSSFTPFLHPTAIQLISKKVASQTGDLRKSFDIAQRAIDLVESETKENLRQRAASETQSPQKSPPKTPLGENPNLSSPRSPTVLSPEKRAKSKLTKANSSLGALLCELTAETAPQATLAHVVRVTSAAFGNSLLQRFKVLNLQQKAILCSLAALEHRNRQALSMPSPSQTPEKSASTSGPSTPTKRGSQAAPTMRDLREAYTSVCRQDNILHALSSTEFRDVVANLETSSLVAAVDGKVGSLAVSVTPQSKKGRGAFGSAQGDERGISARVGIQDLESGIEGVGSDILKKILRAND